MKLQQKRQLEQKKKQRLSNMATRKKKTTAEHQDDFDIPIMADAKSVMRKKKVQVAGPSVVKGTHLTVTTHEDGSTTLEWDDDQLLKEVREAIASLKKPSVRAKSSKKIPAAKKTVTKKKV